MTSEAFQLGQIWQRGRYHGLLLTVNPCDGYDKIYTVFLFERGTTTEWLQSYMTQDIMYKEMRLIA